MLSPENIAYIITAGGIALTDKTLIRHWSQTERSLLVAKLQSEFNNIANNSDSISHTEAFIDTLVNPLGQAFREYISSHPQTFKGKLKLHPSREMRKRKEKKKGSLEIAKTGAVIVTLETFLPAHALGKRYKPRYEPERLVFYPDDSGENFVRVVYADSRFLNLTVRLIDKADSVQLFNDLDALDDELDAVKFFHQPVNLDDLAAGINRVGQGILKML